MYSLLYLLSVDEAHRADIANRLRALGAQAAPVMEGNFNGGDIAARFSFADEDAYRSARSAINLVLTADGVTQCNWALFEDKEKHNARPGLADGVWRGLLLCADRPNASARLAEFEQEMVLMPKYISAIRNWRFNRAIEAGGDLVWTHIWEQEYDDLGGLLGPYMLHPYHWAMIDRWFDPECPDCIVNTRLCHSFAAFGAPVLS